MINDDIHLWNNITTFTFIKQYDESKGKQISLDNLQFI